MYFTRNGRGPVSGAEAFLDDCMNPSEGTTRQKSGLWTVDRSQYGSLCPCACWCVLSFLSRNKDFSLHDRTLERDPLM